MGNHNFLDYPSLLPLPPPPVTWEGHARAEYGAHGSQTVISETNATPPYTYVYIYIHIYIYIYMGARPFDSRCFQTFPEYQCIWAHWAHTAEVKGN